MNVLMVTYIDCANSGSQLLAALSSVTDWRCDYIVNHKIPANINERFLAADVIWAKGDTLPRIKGGLFTMADFYGKDLPKLTNLPVKKGVKMLFTAGGSFFRRPTPGFPKCYGKIPLQRYIENCDAITSITPDLNYPELKGQWLPHAFDVANINYQWKPPDEFIISAYRGQLDCKGVEKHLAPAVVRLNRHGFNIQLNAAKGLPKDVFIELKKASSIYFGEISELGVYGMSIVEAMAYGVPTINRIKQQSIEQAYPYSNYGEPLIKAHDSKSLLLTLRAILDGKVDLVDISKRSREYAMAVHDYSAVGKQVKKIIEGIA